MDQQAREPTLREYFLLLYRRRFTVLGVFLITTGAIAAVAYLTPPVYNASASLIVRFGREFVYRSEIAGLDSSKAFDLSQMVNSEVEILKSRDLARQVLVDLGGERLYSDIFAREPDRERAMSKAAAVFQDSLTVTAVFDSSIIRLTFQHRDAQVAAEALNTLVDRFRDKHVEVFGDSSSSFFESQLAKYQERLAGAEERLRSFRQENRIHQVPEQEKAILTLQVQLEAELRGAAFRLAELESKLATIGEDGMIPAEYASNPVFSSRRTALLSRRNGLVALLEEADFKISDLGQILGRLQGRGEKPRFPVLFDSRVGRIQSIDEGLVRLLDLELKERELLRTHKDESRDLVAVRAEIALVKTFLEQRGGDVGRELEGATLGELSSQRERRKGLAEQIAAIDAELRALDSRERSLFLGTINGEAEVLRARKKLLEGELARLDRDLSDLGSKQVELLRLERNVTLGAQSLETFTAKYEEAKMAEDLDEMKIVNIRPIEKASPPIAPSGLSRVVQLGVGGVIGVVAGVALALFLELLKR